MLPLLKLNSGAGAEVVAGAGVVLPEAIVEDDDVEEDRKENIGFGAGAPAAAGRVEEVDDDDVSENRAGVDDAGAADNDDDAEDVEANENKGAAAEEVEAADVEDESEDAVLVKENAGMVDVEVEEDDEDEGADENENLAGAEPNKLGVLEVAGFFVLLAWSSSSESPPAGVAFLSQCE